MQITTATTTDLDAVCDVLNACRLDLEARGLRQWDAQYPSRSFIGDAIAAGSLSALRDSGRVCGVVVLDESQAPEWRGVAWRVRKPPFLIVHALAVAPDAQGRGCGRELLRFCENRGRERAYSSVRLDVFSENAAALRFYQRQGYVYCGEVTFGFKPPGHRLYHCHEKPLPRGRQNIEPGSVGGSALLGGSSR